MGGDAGGKGNVDVVSASPLALQKPSSRARALAPFIGRQSELGGDEVEG